MTHAVDIAEWCEGIIPFIWDRLPLQDIPEPNVPSLAEDWFCEDALDAGSPFLWRGKGPEQSHRLLYRYARAQNVERLLRQGRWQRNAEWLLLHQVTVLIPTLLLKAGERGA